MEVTEMLNFRDVQHFRGKQVRAALTEKNILAALFFYHLNFLIQASYSSGESSSSNWT